MLQGVPVQLRLTGAERRRFAVITLVLASASALAMAVLYHPGLDTTRIYDGTDTRAFGLLIGAAAALLFPSRSLARRLGLGRRVALDLSGTIALAGIVVLIWRTGQYSPSTYRGGLVLLSVLSAVVVVCAARTASVLAWALGRNPLRWLGVRSYGIYLWHYPIIVLTTPLVGPATHPYRAIAQLAGTVVAAALSWRFVEEPIRKGALGRIWTNRRRAWHWRTWSTGWRLSGLVAAVAVLATACVGASTVTHRASSAASANRPATTRPSAPPGQTSTSPSPDMTSGPASSSSSVPPPPSATPRPGTTSCTDVVHIGDSTSEGLISPDYLPDPTQRIDAQYRDVGVSNVDLEIDGGTSILETVKAGQANAYQVTQNKIAGGYQGCWVLALGTNDTADVYVGSVENQTQRIDKMMSAIGNQPVLWLTVKSLLASGPYAETQMAKWNQALLSACARYPNMRVYDWASVAQDSWFINDGIHYTTTGYANRAHLIAAALAAAFPAGNQASTSCVVS